MEIFTDENGNERIMYCVQLRLHPDGRKDPTNLFVYTENLQQFFEGIYGKKGVQEKQQEQKRKLPIVKYSPYSELENMARVDVISQPVGLECPEHYTLYTESVDLVQAAYMKQQAEKTK
jgi:hypothetical protein